MDEKDNGNSVSLRKQEANRRNAQSSTGRPKSEAGKNHSRLNALKHGVLTSALLIRHGLGAEDAGMFDRLLQNLLDDRQPVGALEEAQVVKIGVCMWRERRALQAEAGLVQRSYGLGVGETVDEILRPELTPLKDHLRLPLGPDLDRILRYEAAIQRQLVYSLNQLERLQRARKGEHVPAPVSVQLSSDE